MSNWERRPLRQSQQHYAALDAFCLIEIINILAKMAEEKGDPQLLLANQKKQLNCLETNLAHHYHGGRHNHHGGRQNHHNYNNSNHNNTGHQNRYQGGINHYSSNNNH